jgi:hypothetical protein
MDFRSFSWEEPFASHRRRSKITWQTVEGYPLIGGGKSSATGDDQMIKPRYLPPNICFDDPADHIDAKGGQPNHGDLVRSLASQALTRCGEWITRGGRGAKNRAFRTDIVLLSITPQFLPTKRPSAAWVGQQHGVSRQRASELWREFSIYIGPYIQFRGQRFLNQRNARFRARP